jgi:cyclohexyl-isocyanide hydratase
MNRRNALQAALASAAAALAGTGQTLVADDPQSAAVAAHEAIKPVSPADRGKLQILMLAYPKFTALDLVGPQHVFSMLGPEFKSHLVWKDTKELISDTGITVRPTLSFRDCTESPEILFIPGGTEGTLAAMNDPEVREFVANRGKAARYVTSVCTGSLILGAAGLLNGYKATSHWLALESLKLFGADAVQERVVVDRNRITGAGVTAGIDFALALAAMVKNEFYAKTIQLMMEYDPHPPYASGSPANSDPASVAMLQAMVIPFIQGIKTSAAQISK